MDDTEDMPIPGLAEAFVLEVALDTPVIVGRLATGGLRVIHPVAGGSLRGPTSRGSVSGGNETRLSRGDEVTVIDANYLVTMADGAAIRILGTGYMTRGDPFDGTRLTLSFEVDQASPHAWLANRAFIAERPANSPAFQVVQII